MEKSKIGMSQFIQFACLYFTKIYQNTKKCKIFDEILIVSKQLVVVPRLE